MNVLITGDRSGIGYDLGMKLINKGYFVYLGVKTELEKEMLIRKIDIKLMDKVRVIKLDITNENDRDIVNHLDIDCLVNQAGIGIGGSLIELPISEIRKNFEVNFFSTFRLVQIYINDRIKKNKKGRVLVTSSIAGMMALPYLGSYCSTKSAISTMTTCLNKELKSRKIDIKMKLIEPGAYKTGFNQVMINNKEKYMSNCEDINKKQELLFNLIEKRSNKSIVNKMYDAIISESNKLIYRSPFIQVMGAKIYMLLFR